MFCSQLIIVTFLLAITAFFTATPSAAVDATPTPVKMVDRRRLTEEQIRQDMQKIAEGYLRYTWVASSPPLHDSGKLDTPDHDYCRFEESTTWGCWKFSEENIGVPYFWGGGTSIRDQENRILFLPQKGDDVAYKSDQTPPGGVWYFDERIGVGAPAGNINTTANTPPWERTAGVDCAGFASQVWRLGFRADTYGIGDHGRPIKLKDLRLGDVLLRLESFRHVIVFKEFITQSESGVGTRFWAYESSKGAHKVVLSEFEVVDVGTIPPIGWDQKGNLPYRNYDTDSLTLNRIRHCSPADANAEGATFLNGEWFSCGNRWYQDDKYTPRTYFTPLDIVLVIDNSGSMAGDKIARVRQAANLFVDSMRTGDKISVVSFDRNPQIKYQLTEINPDDGPGSVRANAKTAINSLLGNGSATSIGAGLEAAFYQLEADALANHRLPVIILFSDGAENSPPLARQVVQDLWNENIFIPIYSFGIGSGAHPALLYDLSRATGGKFNQLSVEAAGAEKAAWDAIHEIIGKLYGERFIGTTPVGEKSVYKTIPAGGNLGISVLVDSSMGSLTITLHKPEGASNITWSFMRDGISVDVANNLWTLFYSGQTYDLIFAQTQGIFTF
jgi:uncharacterized protein YegL